MRAPRRRTEARRRPALPPPHGDTATLVAVCCRRRVDHLKTMYLSACMHASPNQPPMALVWVMRALLVTIGSAWLSPTIVHAPPRTSFATRWPDLAVQLPPPPPPPPRFGGTKLSGGNDDAHIFDESDYDGDHG